MLDEVAKSNLFYSTIAKVRRLSDDLIHINIKSFEKSIQNEVDEFAKIYDEDGDTLINLLKGDSASVKISTSEIIKARKKLLLKKFGTKLEKVESFDNPNVLAQFDPNTNTIRYKDEVTEYFMAHESFHAEEMKLIGFDEYVKNAPLRGVKEAEYLIESS